MLWGVGLASAYTMGGFIHVLLIVAIISHAHGRVDAERLRAFVASYQEIQPLRLGELWAIPIMLRLALLENLRRVAGAITAGRHEREAAANWVARMLVAAAAKPTDVVVVLAELVETNPPLTNAFVAELASRAVSPRTTAPWSRCRRC